MWCYIIWLNVTTQTVNNVEKITHHKINRVRHLRKQNVVHVIYTALLYALLQHFKILSPS